MAGICRDIKQPITIVNNRVIHDANLRYEDISLLVSKSENNTIDFNDLVKSNIPEKYVFIDCTREGL